MSGQLKLKGATSGSSIISAPDSGSDEQFTLPATGGELATAPVGGQVVGYQQGMWLPTVNAGGVSAYNTSWERIGNQVSVRAQINNFTFSGDSPINVQSLPYLVKDGLDFLGVAIATRFDNACTSCLASAGTNITFYQTSTGDNAPWREQKYADRWNDAYSGIWFTVTYQTDDTTWQPSNGASVS